jgi:hypothetical protein
LKQNLRTLQENLDLALKAVNYAKEHVRRSANQHYFKSANPFQEKRRNQFLLGATRGTGYVEQTAKDPSGLSMKTQIKDPILDTRRQMVAQLLASNRTKAEKDAQIDEWIEAWGLLYFWGSVPSDVRFEEKPEVVAMRGSPVPQDKKDLTEYENATIASKAKKFGVGNCFEKAHVAAQYILDQSPGGRRLAIYSLDPNHPGVTGMVTGEGGDHAFAVYGMDYAATNIESLGPDAIIIDGWMNDAYPARHHLKWKYGYNYNGVRINLKQFTTRNMICVSYRNHLLVTYNFGVLAPGIKILEVPNAEPVIQQPVLPQPKVMPPTKRMARIF